MNFGKSVIETHKNYEMANMLTAAESKVETARGKFGYAIARNIRKLNDACLEFLQARQDLMSQYGSEVVDESGKPTGELSLKIGTDACAEFLNRLNEYAEIEHDVEIYKVPYDILPDDLTAKDLLDLEWMLYDSDEQGGSNESD